MGSHTVPRAAAAGAVDADVPVAFLCDGGIRCKIIEGERLTLARNYVTNDQLLRWKN